VGAPGFFLLNQAIMPVNAAFDTICWLVGTAIEYRNWRDIDVRAVLPDEQYQRLFLGIGTAARVHPLWSLLCSSTSLWLAQATGLPVDFQVQTESRADERYAGRPRIALGVFPRAAVSDVRRGGGGAR
jgi:hypothetical protein